MGLSKVVEGQDGFIRYFQHFWKFRSPISLLDGERFCLIGFCPGLELAR